MKITAIIPARGGSKTIKNKNIKLFLGEPLIYYSIKQAHESKYINRIILTTDNEEIRQIGMKYGVEAPFLRPKNISGDLSTDLEFFEHYLEWTKENEPNKIPDILVQLRTTYPTRSVKLIDECIELLMNNMGYDCVRTISEYNSKTPFKMYTVENNCINPLFKKHKNLKEPYNLCRQEFPQIYTSNGCVDVIKTDTILKKKSVSGDKMFPKILDETEIDDIDTIEEWIIAENKYRKRYY